MLDYMLDDMLDYIIIGFVIIALQIFSLKIVQSKINDFINN